MIAEPSSAELEQVERREQQVGNSRAVHVEERVVRHHKYRTGRDGQIAQQESDAGQDDVDEGPASDT